MKNTRKVLFFIWKNMKKYRPHAIMVFLLWGIFVFTYSAVIPLYVKKITDALTISNFEDAFRVILILLGIYIFSRILVFISLHLMSWFESRLSRDLDKFSYNHFTKHSYDFFANEFTGSLVDKLKRLGLNMISIADNLIFNFFSLFVGVVSIFWVLFRENITIGFIFLVFLVMYILLMIWMGKKMAPVFKDRSVAKSKYSGVVSDIVSNIQTVLFFENRKIDSDIFDRANQNFHKKRYRAWSRAINFQETIGILPVFFTISVVWYGVYLASQGSLTTGSVILIFIMSRNLNSQVRFLGDATKRFVSNISDTVEAIEIIERDIDVKNPQFPEEINIKNGNICFRDVSFIYPGGDHVFKKFNLDLKAGQSVGIVGKSGSGKTTITKLILRLYDIDNGNISIDGQDVRNVNQDDLRGHIAYIPQETILFHRTIYENIAYANPDATHDEVIQAAKAAHVDEFIQKLKDGYDTKVGERGVKLSGGQRQRVGIARAMLKYNAPILVMDEATSSLDSKSEQYIQESFKKLSENRTTIVIAHRLSTIQKLDRIIVMNQGDILEDGTHNELLKKGGHYAELWHSQIDGFIPDN